MKLFLSLFAISFIAVSCLKKVTENSIVVDLRENRYIINGEDIKKEYVLGYLQNLLVDKDSNSLANIEVKLLISEETLTGTVVDIKKELKYLGLERLIYKTGIDNEE